MRLKVREVQVVVRQKNRELKEGIIRKAMSQQGERPVRQKGCKLYPGVRKKDRKL